jgi:transglutaminase-like putative cysteine protease
MSDTLQSVEAEALDHLQASAGHLDDEPTEVLEAPEDADVPVARLALAMAFPILATAVMVGGVFDGVAVPRIMAAIAGLLGIGLAAAARRIRRPFTANLAILVGLFAIGLVLIAFSGLGNVAGVARLTRQAAASGDVLRPPVNFAPGWYAIVGWLMGILGFAALWVAAVLRKPSIALLVPLPVAAFAGISVPEDAQKPSGVIVLVLFALGLGLLSSARQFEGGARPPLAYEVRKLLKSLPLIAIITGALILLAQTSVLFPEPKINPAEEPQKPKTVPLDEVEDRVLFQVLNPDGGELTISGPWRMGTLDVYDGTDWRLPAFNDASLVEVDAKGIVDERQFENRGIKAEFKVLGLGGAALPGLPNLAAVVAKGPQLAYDTRTGTLRVSSGQAPAGLRYTVAAAGLPKIDELRAIKADPPKALQKFVEIPDAPPAVQKLLSEAESRYDNRWDRFDYVRTYVLDNVTATGPGTPVSITPARAQEILGDSLEASPYEIVALQAMLGRWVGVPSRIAYGFDGGQLNGDTLEIRPRNGASFPEVYFEGKGWLPVIGTPKKAKPTVGSDPGQQQLNPDVLPSNEVAVKIFLPSLVPPPSTIGDQVKVGAAVVLVLALLLGALWTAIPVVRKAILRSRRRSAARAAGPRARIALAYAEWRDLATDFGYAYSNDTPLMFLDRFVDDAEHAELAWLTTRALWGDLRTGATNDLAAAAEELSRALRRRLASSQPGTMRFVATVSRLSLRNPYAPDADLRRLGRAASPAADAPPPVPPAPSDRDVAVATA